MSIRLTLTALIISLLCAEVSGDDISTLSTDDNAYKRYFFHFSDKRNLPERILNSIGFAMGDVGRSYALIAGVGRYPKLPASEGTLEPAQKDLERLQLYFRDIEFFDEIIVLKDADVNFSNLQFFLQSYLPDQLEKHPKSRFVFAYSGHGSHNPESGKGYLVTTNARSLTDVANCLDLEILRTLMGEVIRKGHHNLVLINACHSGAFLRRSFGSNERGRVSKYPGSHAIMCSGTSEYGYHIRKVGQGSVFFEKFFAGLSGIADTYPKQNNSDGTAGDGMITFGELSDYLRQEVQLETDQNQNPLPGDISLHGSAGSIFFLNRDKFTTQGDVPEWKPTEAIPFGGETLEEVELKDTDEKLRDIFANTARNRLGTSELQSTLVSFQGILHRAQLYDGALDGIPGPKTSLAISSWQDRHGLSQTGTLDDETIKSLENAVERVYSNSLGMKFVSVKGTQVLFSIWETRVRDFKQYCKEMNLPYSASSFQQVDDHPVVKVSWNDAQRFCKWLSDKEGRNFRLPTDEEWSQAVNLVGESGASPKMRSERLQGHYPWGASFPPPPNTANLELGKDQDNYSATAPVGSFRANESGLYDLAGNVWEWCQDTYDGRPNSTTRVLRGGGWGDSQPTLLQSSFRFWADQEHDQSESIGFRVVVEPEEP